MQKKFGFILLILSISSFSFPSQKDKSESQPELKHIIQGEFESSGVQLKDVEPLAVPIAFAYPVPRQAQSQLSGFD